MTEILELGASRLRIIREDPSCLEVEATYDPFGAAPPLHLHPAHDEHFAVTAGRLTVQVDGTTREHGEGETLTVLRGSAHRMWNADAEPAHVIWQSVPSVRAASWLRGVASLQDAALAAGRAGPDLLSFCVHAARHRDTYRLVVGGRAWLGTVVVAVLGGLGSLLRR